MLEELKVSKSVRQGGMIMPEEEEEEEEEEEDEEVKYWVKSSG